MIVEGIKFFLRVIPEAKLNPVASGSSFASPVWDIERQRDTARPMLDFVTAITAAMPNEYLAFWLPQALQCCIFTALLPMWKFHCVSPTWLSLGPHLSPDSFQATQKYQGIQHIPSEPGDRLLSTPVLGAQLPREDAYGVPDPSSGLGSSKHWFTLHKFGTA